MSDLREQQNVMEDLSYQCMYMYIHVHTHSDERLKMLI